MNNCIEKGLLANQKFDLTFRVKKIRKFTFHELLEPVTEINMHDFIFVYSCVIFTSHRVSNNSIP